MPSPIQLQRLPRRKKPAPTRALLFLALLLIVLICPIQEAMSKTDTKPCTVRAFLLWVDSSAAALLAAITQVRYS